MRAGITPKNFERANRLKLKQVQKAIKKQKEEDMVKKERVYKSLTISIPNDRVNRKWFRSKWKSLKTFSLECTTIR